ncbi:hypothetical protein IWGMT90018_30010 [Mycobacterium kiyosense]|nr:hypothetical protein IWGMT90018_30010 [Mycobacterium kiyosense]
MPGAVTMTNVLVANATGSAASSPALATLSICAVSAEAKTSAVAPWVNWVARSEDPAKLNLTSVPGLSALKRVPIWVNALFSEAAANTTIDRPDGELE